MVLSSSSLNDGGALGWGGPGDSPTVTHKLLITWRSHMWG